MELDKLREAVNSYMDYNQALLAWDLVKDAPGNLRDRVWLKVKHAFDPESYKNYYSELLVESPFREEYVYDCTGLEPRLKWCADNIVTKKQSPMVDLGCADGFFSLTVARYGIDCIGVNLYQPSVDLANKRAKENNLPAKFYCENLLDHISYTGYQAVVMMEVLEHMAIPEEGMAKAYQLAKPGASIYLSTPRDDHVGIEKHLEEVGRESWDDGKPAGHLRLFTEEEFKNMLKPYKVEQFLVDENKNMCVEIIKEV